MANIKGLDIGYIRVSSYSSVVYRQLDGIDLDKTFTENVTAKDKLRPVLKECIASLHSFDHLHVHSMDRLARNLIELQTLVTSLNDKGVAITFHEENLTFTGDAKNLRSKLMHHLMGVFSDFERSLIKERQKEGIARAREMGKQIGRKRALNEKQIEEIKLRLAGGESKSALAKEFGVARQTLYSVIQNELKNRFAKVKPIAMMEMRERMGAVELVNWWKNFIAKIRPNTTFEDLDKETQELLLKWEKLLRKADQ